LIQIKSLAPAFAFGEKNFGYTVDAVGIMYTSIETTLGYEKSSGQSTPRIWPRLWQSWCCRGEHRTPYPLPAQTVDAWTQAEATIQLPVLCAAASVTVYLELLNAFNALALARPTIDAITRDTDAAPID